MGLLSVARDLKRRKAREGRGLFVAEGVRATEELLAGGLQLRGALVAPKLSATERGERLLAALRDSGAEVVQVTDGELESAADTDSPQGVVAVVEVPERKLSALQLGTRARIVVMDAVQDPGNVGAIVRTAAAFGAAATVALPGTADLWNAKVVRGAMGALFHHFAVHATHQELAVFLEKQEIEMWAADAEGEPLEEVTAPERLALAIGNEGGGLSAETRNKASRTVRLDISERVESLNVAVAAGVMLYALR